MLNKINQISEKYIAQLEHKKLINVVKINDAKMTVKQAVNEVADIANKSIQEAVEPLKAKIAQKDEYIKKGNIENNALQNKVNHLEKTNVINSKLLDKYKNILKEAYKQEITPEIKEQKSGLAGILANLFSYKQTQESQKIINQKQAIVSNPVKSNKTVISKSKTAQVVSDKTLSKISNERKKQILDKDRMELASLLIKDIIGDMQAYDYNGISEQYKKLNTNKNYKKIASANSLQISMHENEYEFTGERGPHIRFLDKNKKDLLILQFNNKEENIGIKICDKKGVPMVTSKVKDGVVENLSVNFNEVQPIADSEIVYDKKFNDYAQNLITNAKKGTVSKISTFSNTKTVDYFTRDNINVVSEYSIDSEPIFTYIANPNNGKLEKRIDMSSSTIDKRDENLRKVRLSVKGVAGATKYKQDKETFSIRFYPTSKNERFASQDIYDKNTDDKYKWQKLAYSKINYGLTNHPLTSAFTYFDMGKHQIKPWDFSMLNPYIK